MLPQFEWPNIACPNPLILLFSTDDNRISTKLATNKHGVIC